MKKKTKRIGTGKVVGRPQASRGNSSSSYAIIDKCDKCPVYVYEDVVCNGNLRALVVDGNPPEDALMIAKLELVTEFAELSGDKTVSASNNHLRQVYMFRGQIMGLMMAADAMQKSRGDAVGFMRDAGLPVKVEMTDEAIQKKIVAKMKNLDVRLREELKRYEASMPTESGKSTADGFTAQLIALSDEAGVHLTKDIMMSEFAIRIKNLEKKREYEKRIAHTR